MLLSDLYQRVYRNIMSSQREEVNALNANISAIATTFSVNGTQGSIDTNAILQIDGELMLVTAVGTSSGLVQVTVVRAYFDSVAAAHTGGTQLIVNPRFPFVEMVQMANETLDLLSAPANGMYQPATIAPIYNPAIVGYDFYDPTAPSNPDATKVIDLLEVRVWEFGPWMKWPVVPLSQIRLNRNADPDVFPLSASVSSNGYGMALEFMGGGYPGRPIRTTYSYPYNSALLNFNDDIGVVSGLQPTAFDILELGATYRMFIYRDLKRSFSETQFEPRRAQEVPNGSAQTAMKSLELEMLNRISQERQRLHAQYKRRWR